VWGEFRSVDEMDMMETVRILLYPAMYRLVLIPVHLHLTEY